MDTVSRGGRPKLFKVDKELVIVFLLVAITGFIFYFVVNQRAFLNFFYLPVLFGAYFFGKRYATMSAVLSIVLVWALAYVYPSTFTYALDDELFRWLDLVTWGGFLLVTGYAMGLLYERKEVALGEIRKTYQGVLEMLSIVIDSVDKETYNHSHRVSVISEQIARQMGCDEEDVENIRVAALLHDLGKIGTSTDVLLKLGKLTENERQHMKSHPGHAVMMLEPVGGKVADLIPIILHHHERFDGTGYNSIRGEKIPLGARIVAVADVFDALAYDRPYRKAVPPAQALEEIVEQRGTHFDPDVVTAFEAVFSRMAEQEALPGGRP